MKNIHILLTDEPSRLIIYSTLLNEFRLLDKPIEDWKHKRHIYITSDEEIKEGDWFALDMSHSSTLPDEIHQMGSDNWSKTGGIHFCEGNSWIKSCKKIILTTDQDLIKNGIQAIDDEFLEWFVKNPSCEEVEIMKLQKKYVAIDKYETIIPEEEPKFENSIENTINIMSIANSMFRAKEKPKQETLEVMKDLNYYKNNAEEDYKGVPISVLRYINELEKQQEKMYSEEEIYNLIQAGYSFCEKGKNREDVKKWFEQFKKK